MKETKKFFDTNRLNKGYNKSSVHKQKDSGASRGQNSHVLPPLDIMAEYEEMNPGTIDKILKMAEKEQDHRHQMEMLAIEKNDKAIKIGRQISLVLVGIIALAAIILTFEGHYMVASIFSIAGFGTIGWASSCHSKKNAPNKTFHKNFDPDYRSPNYKGKKRW
jgi:uncharacterized membrane protein